MAVVLIASVVGAILMIGMAIYVVTPIMYTLKGDTALWANVPAEGLAIRDNTYLVFGVLPIPLLGLVFLWGYMRSTRRQPDEF